MRRFVSPLQLDSAYSPGKIQDYMLRVLPLPALVLLLCSAVPGLANGLTYDCGSGISSSTCSYLQNTVAALYNNTFSNINTTIYVQVGSIPGEVAETTQNDNYVPYSSYLSALSSASNGNTIDVDALNALNNLDTAIYGSGNVELTASLDSSLGGLSVSVVGTQLGGGLCIIGPGNPGCYDAVITVSSTQAFYYRGTGNTNANETSNEVDFFSAVEHETDEALGTASCVNTLGSLADDCSGVNTPSAVDLFRYQSPGDLVLLSTTAGAYFSYNGGATNGADGALYNTLANGNDYADFVTYCSSTVYIQDASICPGKDANLDITDDGPGHTLGPEVNILSAVGYQLDDPIAPEPGSVETLALGGLTLGLLGYCRRRKRSGA